MKQARRNSYYLMVDKKAAENRVFVARRPLAASLFQKLQKEYGVSIQVANLAHSAILLRVHGHYHLVEYHETSSASSMEVPAKDVSDTSFTAGGMKWEKQKKGHVIPDINPHDVMITMNQLMSGAKYEWSGHNCHVAQEATRSFYGWTGSDPLSYAPIVAHLVMAFKEKQK